MRDTFVKTLLEIAKKDKNVYIVTGDLGFGVLKPFWDELPDQIINAGIAEQNMTSIAAGLAMQGKVVYTYSIGNFPTLRCIEQIRNDCAYHDANVKVVCVGGGFVYGSLGMSHHATEDIAMMRALPNVTVVAPGDLVEAACATKAIYETPGTCYLRLGRGGEKQIHDSIDNFEIGKAIKIQDGEKIAIFSTGAIFDEVELNGTTVQRASLANPDTMRNLGVKIGSKIVVVKRGEIIPKIESILNDDSCVEKEIEISPFEMKILRKVSETNRQKGIGFANEICKSYRREGKYFDEILEEALKGE